MAKTKSARAYRIITLHGNPDDILTKMEAQIADLMENEGLRPLGGLQILTNGSPATIRLIQAMINPAFGDAPHATPAA